MNKRTKIYILILLGVFILSNFVTIISSKNIEKIDIYKDIDYIPNELILEFDQKVINVNNIEQFNGYIIKRKVISLNAALIDVKSNNLYKVADLLENQNGVLSADLNYIVTLNNEPTDPHWAKQYGPKLIKCSEAWESGTGSKSVTVAIVDTGIDYTHPDLASNMWKNTGEIPGNLVDDDGNGFIDDYYGMDFILYTGDPKDRNGHGTHCAGIVGAVMNNNEGITGVAQVNLMAVKSLSVVGSGSAFSIIEGIEYAANMGADIISMSLGMSMDIPLIETSCIYANSKGSVLIAAAGNDHTDEKHYPAAYDCVVSVSAIDEENQLAEFSNYGNWIDIAAPGVNIFSTLPTYPCDLTIRRGFNEDYDYLSGTSMACPHVSGVAALIKSNNQNWNNDEIKDKLLFSADEIGDEIYFGNGRVDATMISEEPDTRVKVYITIDKIKQLDALDWEPPIDDGNPEWFYSYLVSTSKSEELVSNHDSNLEKIENGEYIDVFKTVWRAENEDTKTWRCSDTHTFYVDSTEINFEMKVYDYDFMLHDIADISSKENPAGDIIPSEEGRNFEVTYNLLTNNITDGDKYETDGLWWYTRGDWDNSTGSEIIDIKQDDVKVWFKISDTYEPPKVDANGPYYGKTGEKIEFSSTVENGLGPYNWGWDFDISDGIRIDSTKQNPTKSYSKSGTYIAIVNVTDDFGGYSTDTVEVIISNRGPTKPLIRGETQGKTGKTYDYYISTTDPEGDDVFYYIEWGDGEIIEWDGPYTSGEEQTFTYQWSDKNEYDIRVKAKDINGIESEWVSLTVTMPRIVQINNLFLLKFFENHPLFEKILLLIHNSF